MTQKNAEQENFENDVVEERQVHHALAQVDGALAHDLARGVAGAEPDRRDHQEEDRAGVVGGALHAAAAR